MSLTSNFVTVAVDRCPTQADIVDNLTEEAPILGGTPMEAASSDLFNTYEELLEVQGAETRDIDAGFVTMSADSKVNDIKLTSFGGTMKVTEETAQRMGGAAAYFTKRIDPALRVTGASIEHSEIYDNMRAAAIGYGNYKSASGSGTDLNSIICVKWTPGYNTGLYSEEMFGRGSVMDLKALSDGALYENPANNGQLIYGMRALSYIGFQMADSRGVSAIVNIDPTTASTNKPTAMMLDDMISDARGNPGNTVMYMHPKVYNHFVKPLISYDTSNGDNNVYQSFASWNGIAIVQSYNFDGNGETTVS